MKPPACPRCGAPLEGGVCARCPPAPVAISRSVESDLGEAPASEREGVPSTRRKLPESLSAEVNAALRDPANRIGRYVLLSELGQGGYGAVHRAFDTEMERVVALKVLTRLEARARERFQREVRATARLKHPGIVPIFDVGEAGGQPFLVMDLVAGRPLDDLAREEPLPPLEAARIARDVALAVAAAHEHGILHRDLKPHNVMVDPAGRAVVLDFGLARLPDEAGPPVTQSGTSIGTPAYMSPEQACARTEKIGPASDVYSLGATLYHALTGAPPFVVSTAEELVLSLLRKAPDAPSKRRPVPAALDAIVLRCLAKEPEDRFATAADLARALDAFLAAASPAPRPRGRAPWIVLGVAVVAAASIALLVRQQALAARAAEAEAVRQREAKAAEEEAARQRDAKAAIASRLAVARASVKAASWRDAEKELRAILALDASNVSAHALLAQVLFSLESEECGEHWRWLHDHGPKENAQEYAVFAIFYTTQTSSGGAEDWKALRERIVEPVWAELVDIYFDVLEADGPGRGDEEHRALMLRCAKRLRDLPSAGRLDWLARSLRGFVLTKQAAVTPQPEAKDLLLVARRLLNEAEVANPDSPMASLWLTEVYAELKDWRSAAAAAVRVQALMPELLPAYYDEANALVELAVSLEHAEEQLSLLDRAIGVCERIVTRTPAPRRLERGRVRIDMIRAKAHLVRARILVEIERIPEADKARNAARVIVQELETRTDLRLADRENLKRLRAGLAR